MSKPIKEWLTQEELEAELKRAGVDLAEERSNRNVRRVLYYYRYKGLITPPIRKMVGKRLTLFYHNIVVSEFLTIRLLKARGKSLDDIAEYMNKGARAEFVSSVCDAVREVEARFGFEQDTDMMTMSALSKDGQFIYLKAKKKNVKAIREALRRIGFEPDSLTSEDIDGMVK
ncbi:MAG TPA: MerR family transcriptional regulator [bacterium]|nr:MerR family transcriptional regulator [bacterium]